MCVKTSLLICFCIFIIYNIYYQLTCVSCKNNIFDIERYTQGIRRILNYLPGVSLKEGLFGAFADIPERSRCIVNGFNNCTYV